MRLPAVLAFALFGSLTWHGAACGMKADPRVPAGQHPGGVMVGVLTTGIDYRDSDIAARLARDGEGELIGWDMIDDDTSPFAFPSDDIPLEHGGDGTEFLRDLIAAAEDHAELAIVPVRVDPGDPVSIAKALAFLMRTPVRIVVVPMWSGERAAWEPFENVAQKSPDLRIVVSGCPEMMADDAGTVFPRDLGLPNVLASADGPAGSDGELPQWARVVTDRPCRLPP